MGIPNRLLVKCMGWINVNWKLLAAVAGMQFHRRCVVLALVWKLLSYARVLYKSKTKNFRVFSISSNGGVFSTVKPLNKGHIGDAVRRLFTFRKVVIRGFTVFVGFAVLQMCVWSVNTLCAYIKLTFCLHHARHNCSVFIALWCGCSLMKLTFYLHQTPWLVGTTNYARTPPYHGHVSSPQISGCSFVKQSSPALASRHNGTNNSRTPLYYGHVSSLRIPGLYHIQCIDRNKMADDHDI